MTSKTELKELIEELREEVKGLRQEVATLKTMILFITPKQNNTPPVVIPQCPGTGFPYPPVYPTITYCDSVGEGKISTSCSKTNTLSQV